MGSLVGTYQDEDISSRSTAAKSGWCWGKSFVGLVPGVPQYYHHQVAPQYYYYPVTRQDKPHPCVGLFAALGCIFQTGGTVAHAGEEIVGGIISGTGQAIGGIANGTAAAISGGADGAGSAVGGTAEGVGVGVGGIASETGHQLGDAVTGAGAAIGGAPRIGARLCYSGLYYYYC